MGRRFWILWSSSTVSGFGDGLRFIALPLLAFTLDPRPLSIALVTLLESLPWIVFAPALASVITRWNPRRIMISANVVRGVMVLALAVLSLDGQARMWQIYVLAVLSPFPQIASDTAGQTLLQDVVDDGRRELANSRMYTARTVAEDILGAPVAGALFAVAGGIPLLIDGLTFAIAAALLAVLPNDWQPSAVRFPAAGREVESVIQQMSEGWRALRELPLLVRLSVSIFVLDLALTAGSAIGAIFAKVDVGLTDFQYGLMFSILSVGGIAGGALSPWLVSRFGTMPTLVGAMFLLGIARLVYGLASGVVLAGATFLIVGVGAFIWHVAWSSYLQRVTPPHLLGRVFSITEAINHLAGILGAVLGAALASLVSVRASMVLGGVAVLACAAVSLGLLGKGKNVSSLQALDSESPAAGATTSP